MDKPLPAFGWSISLQALTMMSGNENSSAGYHIVAVPFPGRGHINPMINFCILLASKGIMITMVLTEEWLGLIGSPPNTPNIRIRTIPNVLPLERDRAANYVAFIKAVFTRMEKPFGEILDWLEQPASCLLADAFLSWIISVGNGWNIPVTLLWTQAPSMFPVYSEMVARETSSPDQETSEEQEITKESISAMDLAIKPQGRVGISFSNTAGTTFSSLDKIQAMFFTCFNELQPHEIYTFKTKHPNLPIYTIGPSIPYFSLDFPSNFPGNQTYLPWLDAQEKSSVLYVSLGSFLSTSEEQMIELLKGLQSSGSKFFWVAKNDKLLLQNDCGDKGLLVPWCDQLRVLCHPSVGGFLTHCGFNSTMESIFAGVPMITFPIFADQNHNSKLIVEEWKIGVKLREIVEGKDVFVGRDEIVESVKKLMDFNEESREIRKRCQDLKESCAVAIQNDGSSDKNVKDFIKEFVQEKVIT